MKELEGKYRDELELGLNHLRYSFDKARHLSTDARILDVEQLETWEAFVARFSRISGVFLSKYIRTKIVSSDPGFRGTLRDFLDAAEKFSIISSADQWMKVRELRNKTAHEYTREDLSEVFKSVQSLTPFVIAEIEKAL